MKKLGIDISKHQGDINLAALKDKVEFVIIRAGYSNSIDPKFERNYNLCKELGIPVGTYWYSYALNVDAAKKEANTFLNVLKGKQFEYPVYLDMEDADGWKKKHGYNFDNSKAISEAFCSIVEGAGYYTGIYASKSWFDTYLKGLDRYNKWIAHWSNVSYEDKSGVGMHQYTSKLKLNGYSGNLDGDYDHTDFPAIIKSGGLNGYGKGTETKMSNSKPKPVKPSKPQTSSETIYIVKKGDTLSGIASRYGTTYQVLASYNGISNPNLIGVGQTIKIPNGTMSHITNTSSRTYIVKSGDTLSSIAKKYGTTYQKIAKDNNISNPNKIYPGQKLIIK
nr:MAG TPA: hypothetical protein [Caudoviricetes sp.]